MCCPFHFICRSISSYVHTLILFVAFSTLHVLSTQYYTFLLEEYQISFALPVRGAKFTMTDMKHQLAELTVSLFSPSVNSADNVDIAAKQILRIYSAILELKILSDKLAAIDHPRYDEETKQWNSFWRGRSSLDQMFCIQGLMDLDSTEGKLSWKRVQLLSHDIRYQVASLKVR